MASGGYVIAGIYFFSNDLSTIDKQIDNVYNYLATKYF